ncbi:MAG: peptidylprolyl isomerase [Burkholderiaceae bacterium]
MFHPLFFIRRATVALTIVATAVVATAAHAQFKPGFGPAHSAPAGPDVPAAAARPQSPPSGPQLVDAIIAVVNDDVITQRELLDRYRSTEAQLAAQNRPLPPAPQLQRQLLEQMIVEKAELQKAKELGIKVDEGMLDRAIAHIAEQNHLSVGDLRARLEKDGTTFAAFRDQIRQQILLQRLREREVESKVQVTESEVDNYLAAAGIKEGAKAEQELDVAQILVRVPENASPEDVEQRRQRAEDIRKQLADGADFVALSQKVSDADNAAKGGDLGWRTASKLPQLFLDAVASLKPGEISKVIKSDNGFHVLKLNGRRTAKEALPAVEQTHARHILIKVNQLVSAADAKRKLTELKQRLLNHSATFAELARLYSNDASASKGGDLGWIYPGDTVPEFERAMNALKPGEISDPIETQFGYHLIQVLERKTDDMSPERARQVARQAIRERKVAEATDEWLRQLRDSAYVEYRFDNSSNG